MRIEKIGILLLSMTVLVTAGFFSNQAFAGLLEPPRGIGNGPPVQPVGGLLEPVNESEVYGELAKQYSLWLIPAISAAGIGVYIIKRKF